MSAILSAPKSETDKSVPVSKPIQAPNPKNTAELDEFQLFLTQIKTIISKHTNYFIALDDIERIKKPPTIMTSIRYKESTTIIQQNIEQLARVDTVLYFRLFRDVVGCTKTSAFRYVIVTPLHEAIVCGELDTVELLCKEYNKYESINIAQVGSIRFDSPLDFYINNLHDFTRHWPSEKLVAMYKLLEKYGAVSTTMPKIKDSDIDAIFNTLHQTMSKIFSEQCNQKNVVFAAGESHSSKFSLLVIFIMLCIGKKLGLKKHFHEADQASLEKILNKPGPCFLAPANYVPFSTQLNFEIIAVDLDSELRSEDQTELTIEDRDWGMMSEIRKAKSHGIATVGATHLRGMKKHQNGIESKDTTFVYCINTSRILETSSALQRYAQEDPSVMQLSRAGSLEHLTEKEILEAALAAEKRYKIKEDAINSFARMLKGNSSAPITPAFSNLNQPSANAPTAAGTIVTDTSSASSKSPTVTTSTSSAVMNKSAAAKK